MSIKFWIDKLYFDLSRGIGWRLAASLTFGLLIVAGMRESRAASDSPFTPAPAQEQNLIAARRKFHEGESLCKQGTAVALRLAVKKYEEALLLWRAIGARDGEAATLNNIGLVYDSLGERHKALDFYNQALTLQREVGARNGEATTLNNIGHVYASVGEHQKALDFFNQALTLQREVGDRDGEAITLSNIGSAYDSLDEHQKALDL